MESVHLRQVVEKDGEVRVTGLPCRKGQSVELFLHFTESGPKQRLTARRLLRSGLVGLWKEREDLGESTAYARRLRDQAQHRDIGS